MTRPRSSGLDRRQAEHLASLLRPIVRDRFGGNETAAAKAAGVAQSQFNQIMRATGRGAGISVLIRLRTFLDLTIDEMLGLTPIRSVDDRIRAILTAELDRIEAEKQAPPKTLQPPTPRKTK